MTASTGDSDRKKSPLRRWMILVWALAFFFLLDVGIRIYFSQPNMLERNIDRGIGSLPYFFNQMDRHRGPSVAWVGASVMQGYQNVSADRTFPALVEQTLGKSAKYNSIKSFNLAAAGHNFGDHYSIFTEALRHKPDLVVVAIHFKSFSQHASTSIPIQHEELTAFLPNDDKLAELLDRFRVTKFEYRMFRMDQAIRNVWALYRYRELIPQMAFHTADPPAYVMNDYFRATFGFYSEERQSARLRYDDPEERSIDYLWKLLPDSLIARNHEICANLDFSDSNINWRTFKDICELARKKKVNVLFYLTPINHAIVAQEKFFDWNMLRGFKQAVAQQVRGNGHLLVDLTTTVDSAFFSDTDHINMNGHAQVAYRMSREVKKALDRGKWKSNKKKQKKAKRK